MIGVASASRNGASAFQLIAWLASPDISAQLASAGERMMPVRKSLASSSAGVDSTKSSGEGSESAKMLEPVLNAEQCLLVPRIPGIDEYMAALDEAVKSPPRDKAAAEAALKKVADEWEQITNAHGRDAQRRAYLNHLEITEK
jgi:ABC-type glycerol-3-phosphate transport system substrate-binding protein